jgi:FdhD protein
MGRVTTRRPVVRVSAATATSRPDTLVVEEPLELRLNGTSLTVTMRTPGHDVELAHGFLLGEGIIADTEDVVSARYCAGTDADGHNTYNVLDVALRSPEPVLTTRNFLTTSACGVCGKSSLDQVRTIARHAIDADRPTVHADTLGAMPTTLREQQRVFAATGGLHAAGLFTADGSVLAVREDVGRHNAVDKVLGWALLHNLIPARDTVLIVSGRASFELVQKAVMAGIGMLGAVSAPSSLAVDLAAESGLTLIGFLRGDSMNIYSCPDRLTVPAPAENA